MFNNKQNITEIIIGANGIDDQEWLEKLCIKYILNDDFGIARSAIYGVSNIARIYGQLLNKNLIYEQFNKVRDEKLKYVIQEVNDDLDIFLNI